MPFDTRFTNPWGSPAIVPVLNVTVPEKRSGNPLLDLLCSKPIPAPTAEQLRAVKFERNLVILERSKNIEKRKSAERTFQAKDRLRELGYKI